MEYSVEQLEKRFIEEGIFDYVIRFELLQIWRFK